jgi:carbon-monoxide dehydrogenase medium subunit
MYPPEFEYERAESVDDAVELLSTNTDRETELLAGGHSLLPTLKSGLADPDLLIDIGGLDELRGLESNGDTTTIGALTPYADLESDEGVWDASAVVAEAAGLIGDRQVRNAGTIGGNIAHADPASDMPASVLAAGATIHAQGPDGRRTIPVDDFFVRMYGTALAEDELLTGIEVPNENGASGSAYVKKPSPSSGYALVGVAASVRTNGDGVKSARVAVNGVVDHAIRLHGVERALEGGSLGESAIEAAAENAQADLDGATLMDDVQASGEFRKHLVEVYSRQALHKAADRL